MGHVTLREEIEQRLAPLVPEGKRQEAVNVAISIVEESFSGPIAHPRHLALYEEIQPGAADRIIKMAEKAQDHRIDMQRTSLRGSIDDERLGMIIGSLILVVLVGLAFVAGAIYENNILAGILLAASGLNIIALYLQRAKGSE